MITKPKKDLNKKWKINYQHFVNAKLMRIKITSHIFVRFAKDLFKIRVS